jgi:hypothetical protein
MLTTIAQPSFLKLGSDLFLPVFYVSIEANPTYMDFFPEIINFFSRKLLFSKKELLNHIDYEENYKLHNQDIPLDNKGFRKLILKGIREARELESYQNHIFYIHLRIKDESFEPNPVPHKLYIENFGNENIGNRYEVTFNLTYQDRDISEDISIVRAAFHNIENNERVTKIKVIKHFDLPIKSQKFLISTENKNTGLVLYVAGSDKHKFFHSSSIDQARRYSQKEIDKFLDKDIHFKEKFIITKDFNSIKF